MSRLAALTGLALVLLAGVAVAARQLARSRTMQLAGRIVPRVDTTARLVALTFDDGPTPAVADSLLRVLAARGVRATFFVTGRELAAAPAAARDLVAAGHELGNHSWSHRRLAFVSPNTVRGEIERTDAAIRDAGWRDEILFRPPYGAKLVTLPWYLWRTGRTTVTWDVEPDSYAEVAATSDGIVRHVLDRVRPGSIILLHVWYPSRATSLAAVAALVDSLHGRGYRVTTVRELLGSAPAIALPDTGTRFRGHITRAGTVERFAPCDGAERWWVDRAGRAYRALADTLDAFGAELQHIADGVRVFASVRADTSMLGRYGPLGAYDRLLALRALDTVRAPTAGDCGADGARHGR
jgi:peptidoglycan/xylan/chitin deacetylase (PgdA/CDA1 family)